MNVHELRIGNYLYTDEGKINSVYLISKSVIEFSDPHTICDPDLCSPVLLTEEWLKKIGFVEDPIGVFVMGKVDLERVSASQGFGVSVNQEPMGTEIKYLHHLQNIYFSITGNELTKYIYTIKGSEIKPPLGLKPKQLHYETVRIERFKEVCGAITRYANTGMEINIEWIKEYNELIQSIRKE